MSMINQMLKDLDSRQAGAGASQPVFADVRVAARGRSRLPAPAILALLVVVAGGIGAFAWSRLNRPAEPVSPAPMPVVAAAPAAPALAPAPQIAPAPVAPVSAVESKPVEPAPATVIAAASTTTSPAPVAATSEPIKAVPAPVKMPEPAKAAPEPVKIAQEPVKLAVAPPKAVPEPVAKPLVEPAKPKAAAVAKSAVLTSTPVVATPKVEHKAPAKPAPENVVAPAVAKASAAPSRKATADDAPSKLAPDHAPGFKVVNTKQRSDNLYRQAVSLLQEGHALEAQEALNQSLAANASNQASRLLLAATLNDAGRGGTAMATLREGLTLVPGHSGFSMALARLQVASGAKAEALTSLEQGLASAGDDPDYHAFLAALLQTKGRHDESTQHYLVALRSNPSMPSWLVGIGISLRAINKPTDAAEAFQRAIDTGELSPEVAQFAQQQLKLIRPAR